LSGVSEGERQPSRYICFCGVTVIGATVCPDCAAAMVAVLLEAATARVAIETKGLFPDRDGAEDRIEPVAALAV
jgi:uncharacterized protein (UPF0212 family)